MNDTNDSQEWGGEMDRPEHETNLRGFPRLYKMEHHYCCHYLGDAFALCVRLNPKV